MKTLHILVYTSFIFLCTAFYFNIFTINPQLKQWWNNNPFIPQHHIDTTQGPIKQQPIEITENVNYEDTIRFNNIRALFRNGNESRYEKGEFNEFENYRNRLAMCIYKRFSEKQIKTISNISLIGWPQLEGNIVGCTYYNGYRSSAIDIAVNCGDVETVLYHEIVHAIYFQNSTYFENELQFKWITITDFVSAYAATDITEDIAETGAFFMHGDTLKENEKFDLIRKFFTYTK